MKNEYAGHSLKGAVSQIYADHVSSMNFFEEFVTKRKPLVMVSRNADFLANEFSNARLADIVGDIKVEVEDKRVGPFGSTDIGARKVMKFSSEFLPSIGSGNFYLTTQCIRERQGLPVDFAPVLVRRLIDVGLVPVALPMVGNLVLDNVNIWMGSSGGQSSSGFHHDFHDNLYFLIRGSKTFRLVSPENFQPTHGRVRRIFRNGFVAYNAGLRADGADVSEYCKFTKNPEDIEAAEDLQLRRALEREGTPQAPPHFCTSREAPADAVEVTLNAGDILYLPAGYFHEVISTDSPGSTGHLAVNYWYHPPTENDFNKPYVDNFWASRAEEIANRIEARENRTFNTSKRVYHIKRRPLCRFYTQRQIRMFLAKHKYLSFSLK